MVCDKQEYFTHLCLYKIETLHLVDLDSAWDCTHQEGQRKIELRGASAEQIIVRLLNPFY